MQILVVNPNTSAQATARYVAAVEGVAPPGVSVRGVTGRFGATVVSSRAEEAVAGHAALELIATHAGGCDAVILAISFDSALAAARELLDVPVVGITEAALHAACMDGGQIGLVTFGAVSRALYVDLLARYGLSGRVAGIEVIEIASVAGYLDDPGRDQAVRDAALRLAALPGVCAVVVCGAAVAGIAARLQPGLAFPLLDALGPAVAEAVRLAAAPPASHARPLPLGPSLGLSPALSAFIAGSGPACSLPA